MWYFLWVVGLAISCGLSIWVGLKIDKQDSDDEVKSKG